MRARLRPTIRGFTDRVDAARHLAQALAAYRSRNPLVLAIPRGGVPIGRIVTDALGGELDVILVRKLGAPQSAELAIGAIDEDANVEVSDLAEHLGASHEYVEREASRQLNLIRQRRALYSPRRQRLDPAGRVVIIVDDGLATGATMRSAILAARARKAQRIICAVPVAAPGSLAAIAGIADEVVCLLKPADFYAVGQFYENFEAVEDDEVIALLAPVAPLNREAVGPGVSRSVSIPIDGASLTGDLFVPADATGIVVFAHGSGSSRLSSRNQFVARELNQQGLATLLFDLLTEAEDASRAARFNIAHLSARLESVVDWVTRDPTLSKLKLGLFGASTGAAAALEVAARRPRVVRAVVSRGGRPDLASDQWLVNVRAPTLLIVGGADTEVLELNEQVRSLMRSQAELAIVPRATHLFAEPGALERAAALAAGWFRRWLA